MVVKTSVDSPAVAAPASPGMVEASARLVIANSPNTFIANPIAELFAPNCCLSAGLVPETTEGEGLSFVGLWFGMTGLGIDSGVP